MSMTNGTAITRDVITGRCDNYAAQAVADGYLQRKRQTWMTLRYSLADSVVCIWIFLGWMMHSMAFNGIMERIYCYE